MKKRFLRGRRGGYFGSTGLRGGVEGGRVSGGAFCFVDHEHNIAGAHIRMHHEAEEKAEAGAEKEMETGMKTKAKTKTIRRR